MHAYGAIIDDIRKILKGSRFSISHIICKANQCMDLFAQLRLRNSTGLCIWEEYPSKIYLALFVDFTSTVFVRL